VLDKDKIKALIAKLNLPLALYLKSNLETSEHNWFENRVIKKLDYGETRSKAVIAGDIKVLDVQALLWVFIRNWDSIKSDNRIPAQFLYTIHAMREIRNNYLGHPEIVPDIKVSGLKDLDILIEFSEKIQAVELKEQFQREKDKEIVRLSNEIKSKVDYAEPIESREHDAEVLSVSAAETIHLIEKYLIHSCPDSYSYKTTEYITFRTPPYGEMGAIYKIDKVLLVPKYVKNNLEYFDSQGLILEEIDRLRNYIDGNPFVKNDRFYLLSKLTDLPPSDEQHSPPSPHKPKPRPPEYTTKTLYYTINRLMTGNEEE